jgi:hypothetical protein
MMATPEIRFDPALIEEAVFLALGRGATAFHREREALYELGERQQAAAFQQLARRSFEAMGLSELFTGRFEEFPRLSEHVELILIRRVWSRNEERTELYVDHSCAAQRRLEASTTLFIGLQAGRCLDREALVAWLRHELMHASDMLDPAFAYEPHPALGGDCELEDDLIRERFCLVWDLFVEGRVRRKGWQTLVPEAIRRRQFERAFASWDAGRLKTVWQALRGCERSPQRELLELARDERLTRTLGQGGVRCPLCHFPTREGVREWDGERAAIAEAIRADYSTWDPAQGACAQCVEIYRSRRPRA